MYHRILVPLENTRTDRVIVAHVRTLARHCNASIVLIHVADGFAARNMAQLDLRESEEMRRDRAYLDGVCEELIAEGLACEAVLACGNPADEISAAAEREGADLIAMATHGHRGLNDLIRGSVASEVRHRTHVPVLMVREGAVRSAP
ncbi:MAG: universal stress protein [Gemmatimonadaceae bacterium]|nr:universal stress protein [Gemmatimonadaceae bacterium]